MLHFGEQQLLQGYKTSFDFLIIVLVFYCTVYSGIVYVPGSEHSSPFTVKYHLMQQFSQRVIRMFPYQVMRSQVSSLCLLNWHVYTREKPGHACSTAHTRTHSRCQRRHRSIPRPSAGMVSHVALIRLPCTC